MNTLSDDAIEALAAKYLSAYAQFIGAGEVWVEGAIEFARAVLAAAQSEEEEDAKD